MAILNKGTTYASGDNVTAANLNTLVDSATFKTGSNEATDNSTLQVHGSGYLKIKDLGVGSTQIADDAVITAKIADSTGTTDGVTSAKLATDSVIEAKIAANAVTSAKISSTDTTFKVSSSDVVINEGGSDVDFRVEGDNNANLINANAQNDIVGIGLVPDASDTFGSSDKYIGQVKDGLRIFHDDGVAKLKILTSKTGGGSASITLQSTTAPSANEGHYSIFTGSANGIFNIINETTNNGLTLDNTGTLIIDDQLIAAGSLLPLVDNSKDIGSASKRWQTVFAVVGAINTSDKNQKEEIQELSEAELLVAKACKGLVRRFKLKGGTRKHIGVIAQDVRDAFTTQGLDAHEYGLFCSDTWTDEDTGEEVTQLGIRYDELLAFIISAL